MKPPANNNSNRSNNGSSNGGMVRAARPTKFSCSDEHSSAVLSDDEMSDESVRLQQQLLFQPRVTFAADMDDDDDHRLTMATAVDNIGAEDAANNVYLEMSLMGQQRV